MGSISVLNNTSPEIIISTIKSLGKIRLSPSSHLYPDLGPIEIADAAKIHSEGYWVTSKERPAVALIEVVLSTNRSYLKHVKPNIDRIKDTSAIASFNDLINFITEAGTEGFYKFWGHRNAQKFSVLINILNAVTTLRKKYPDAKDDFELMQSWANDFDLMKFDNDIIGSIRYIAISTLQHLRMTFGCNTIKPDQRLKEVFAEKFHFDKLSDFKIIQAVEQMSAISGLSALLLDQIFINYVSGHNADLRKV